MRRGRSSRVVVGLDLGAVRVGVAVSDELGSMAHPRGVFPAKPERALLTALRELCDAEDAALLIIGLPLDLRGTEGEAARRIRGLAQAIADATGREVELVDERLTTVQAQRALTASEVRGAKARARIDEAAAVTILQSWLDRSRGFEGALAPSPPHPRSPSRGGKKKRKGSVGA